MFHLLLLVSCCFILTSGYDYSTVSNGCGTTRGCMILPSGCHLVNRGVNCTTSVIWERTSTGVRFEFSADISKMTMGTAHWSALGISTNEIMDLDTVMECVVGSNGSGVFRLSWNDKTKNEVLISTPTGFITDTVVSKDNGRLVCAGTWNHAARLLGDASFLFKVYDISNASSQYHLLLARGYADPLTRAKGVHSITDSEFFPWIAGITVSFCPSCSYANLSTTAHQSIPPRKIKHTFAISHGVLMMSAWWIFGSTGILSARYLKNADSTCCTAKIWWALHRPLMLLSFLCASVAFFFIYYVFGFKVRTCNVACTTDDYLGQLHAIIGTVTYSFMCFQVFLGIIRPSAESPMRPCYNWLHWMFGSTAWICASTTFAMAIPLGKTGLQLFYQNWPRHIMMAVILTFIASAAICEYFHRFRKVGEGEKSQGVPSLSPIVPLVIVCNLLVAIAAVALLTWMLLQAYIGHGFTL